MMLSVFLLFIYFLQLSSSYHIHFFVPLADDERVWDESNEGKGYAHALTIAIDDVNNDPAILPGRKLTYNWTDSTNSTHVLHEISKIESNNKFVDVFIGPASKCEIPARLSGTLNIPMISYHCIDESHLTKAKLPTFIRTFPNLVSDAAQALFSLLTHFSWTRIGIIYEEDDSYGIQLRDYVFNRRDLHVASSHEVPNWKRFDKYGKNIGEFEYMFERKQSLLKVRQVLREMVKKEDVKVLVLFTSFEVLIEIMAEVYDLRFIEEDNLEFIGFQLDARVLRVNHPRYPELFISPVAEPEYEVMFRAKKGAKSLSLISVAKPVNTERYEKFRKKLIHRTESQKPFKNPTIFDYKLGITEISEISCALYDAVYQYASTLHLLKAKNESITAEKLVEEFSRHPYEGMCGYISEFRQSDGNIKSHLRLMRFSENAIITKENYMSVHMRTVGNFTYTGNSETNLQLKCAKSSWCTVTPNTST